MNITLEVELYDVDYYWERQKCTVIKEGYTLDGIRVHVVTGNPMLNTSITIVANAVVMGEKYYHRLNLVH